MEYFKGLREKAKAIFNIRKADKNSPTKVQTLIFSKEKFNADSAKAWAKAHNFSATKIDENSSAIRIRQLDPAKFKTMRTITLTEGVKAVVAKKVIGKSSPTSSQVHVPATGRKDKMISKSVEVTPSAPAQNLTGMIEYKCGDKVCIHLPMDHHHGRSGVVEYVSHFDGMTSVRFDDNARAYYLPAQMRMEQAFRDETAQKAHDSENLEQLRESFDDFIAEEALEKSKTKKDANPSEVDESADVYPQLDNLEAEILKDALESSDDDVEDEEDGGGENSLINLYGMQRLVEGMDWELEHSTMDPEMAKEQATENLEEDPDHYRKLVLGEDFTDDELSKSEDGDSKEGINLDLGSGQTREPGFIGVDTYPYDSGTLVHDMDLGLPFPDGCANNVRLCNVEMEDTSPLLSEIHRVLKPGGSFLYEGPNDIYDEGNWSEDYPGLVMTNHEDSGIQKSTGASVVRQEFTRVATPDPATADDAEPRIGVEADEEFPDDQLMAEDALSYYFADATSSGKGNREHGYPSQGALKAKKLKKESDSSGAGDSNQKVKTLRFYKAKAPSEEPSVAEEQVHEALNPVNPNPAPPAKLKRQVSKIEKMFSEEKLVPIMKMNNAKQIVYGVILAPNEIDSQEDYMDPEEIEKAAHRYMEKSRVVGSGHEKPIIAHPVESFIAPQDFEISGQNGPQVVTKGSWVLGVKVEDPEEWQKIVDGEYTGFSVGGYGQRNEV